MTILSAAIEELSVGESLQVFALGFLVVFFILIVLYALIRVLRFITEQAEAPALPSPPQEPRTSGEAYLHTVTDETAALLMGITALEAGIPTENLRIISITEKSGASVKKNKPPGKEKPVSSAVAVNKKYNYRFERLQGDDMIFDITLNNKTYTVEAEKGEAVIQSVQAAAVSAPAPQAAAAAAPSAPALAPQAASGGTNVTSPLPGTVLAIKVAIGDTVTAGQTIAIVEAMKMENEIPAPVAGVIKSVLVQQGASVDTGAALAVIG